MSKFHRRTTRWAWTLALILSAIPSAFAQQRPESADLSAFRFRSIGPAYTGGRVADIAVNPENPYQWFLAVAAGNVWKTDNAGVTWTPIFDKYGSWSMADVELDPNNPREVWVATGEYNSQRAIGYGDGVYLSQDGGASFTNMGLKNTEHIGRLAIDPRNSHVYVAAQGPLWGPGGERGLYKSTDKGQSWQLILQFDENTGATDIVIDPENPDILYCAAYQRRRHVFTLVNGGPGSAIYKSTDAGKTWNKLTSGLPSVDMGRIGLAVSPANPNFVYAIIEAAHDESGVYRSTNKGITWEKRSDYVSTSPQYYNRLYCDPEDPMKVFSMDTYSVFSTDGGKSWTNLGNKNRHVDDHCLWIDPSNTSRWIIGGDGGLYETFDHGANWDFKANLPITQLYRVALDNDVPFFNIYGGTQDNNSFGGPSRTRDADGIVNDDWFVTNGGDGFQSQVDPEDPNVVYAQAQYGWLVRYDKATQEATSIQPQPPAGEAYRWNWNSPLIVSPHEPARLYFAANKLFRSDDRGNSWTVVSPDLTRQIDRNTLPVMGRVQSVDAVAKNASTSFYGNIVALDESPLEEGLLYVGTDDGLVQVSTDGGQNWTRHERFADVPANTYVSELLASRHDASTVFACFDGRKDNDLRPHVLVSRDKGQSWSKIETGLPERGTVYALAEDHDNPKLLFAGTEFGLYASFDAGKNWVKFSGGIPTTQVPDLAIHRRDDALVLATFGRGFYVLDDIGPLRELEPALFDKDFHFFAVPDALQFVTDRGMSAQGSSYFTGKNPEVQATFTFFLKEAPKSLREQRREKEAEAIEAGRAIAYPSWDELRAEDQEEEPFVLLTIKDAQGQVVRRIHAPASPGIQQLGWDLRYPSTDPVRSADEPFDNDARGTWAPPGQYTVSAALVVNGQAQALGQERSFAVRSLDAGQPDADALATAEFRRQVDELGRSVFGAAALLESMAKNIGAARSALYLTPGATDELMREAKDIEKRLVELEIKMSGDPTISSRNENQPPAIVERLETLQWSYYRSSGAPTQTMREQFQIVSQEFEPVYAELIALKDGRVAELMGQMEKIEAPYTPSRTPQWDR